MITVVGGTGRLGRLVCARLVADGQTVRVVGRNAPATPVPGSEFLMADVRAAETLRRALAGTDVVVSAVHGMDPNAGESPAAVDRDGNRNLVTTARAAGADIVLVSVIGARLDHPIELFRMKAAAETMLRDGQGSDRPDWTVIRASAFAEMWLELFRSKANGSGVPRVLGPGRNPVNFVSVDDVAAAVARACVDHSLRGRVVEVAGENLSETELAALVTPVGQHPGHVPAAALWVMGAALRPFRPGLARVARQTLTMERIPMTVDPEPAHVEYPWLPLTPIAETLTT